MLYNVNGKILTEEQTLTKIYNKYINEYYTGKNKKEKLKTIEDILNEIEYINYTTGFNDEASKEIEKLRQTYTNTIFNEYEINTIFSIIENMNITRN